MEDNIEVDYRIPFKEIVYNLYGEDDAKAWSKFILEEA